MNPFNTFVDMVKFSEKFPEEADKRLRQMAKLGFDPPGFSNPEEFVNIFNQSQSSSQGKPPEMLFGNGTSAPQMQMPDELNAILMGNIPQRR